MRSWLSGCAAFKFPSVLLMLLFIATFFLSGYRGESPGSELVDPLRFARMIIFLLLGSLALLDLLFHRHRLRRINAVLWLFLLYALVAMSTGVYSVNPALTVWKAYEVIVHVLVAATFAHRVAGLQHAARILGIVWLPLVFVTLSTAWGIALFPTHAIRINFSTVGGSIDDFTRMYGGVFPRINPNDVTEIGAIVVLLGISYFLVGKENRLRALGAPLLMSLGLATMYYSHSRTSIAGLIVALVIMAIGLRSGKLLFLMVVLGLGAAWVMYSEYGDYVAQYLYRGQQADQIAHLSGRVSIWERSLNKILENPVIGFGYYAGHREIFSASGLDNAYLVVFLGGGAILFTAFLLPIFTLIWQLFVTAPLLRPSQFGHSIIYSMIWGQIATVTIVLLVRNFTGPSFESHHFNIPIFLICSIAASSLYRLGTQESAELVA